MFELKSVCAFFNIKMYSAIMDLLMVILFWHKVNSLTELEYKLIINGWKLGARLNLVPGIG